MTTGRKALLVFGSALGICILGWVLLIGAVYAWGGVMTVRVDNPTGPDLSIPVPLAIVDVALATGEVAFEDFRLEIGEYGPMLREILALLDDCPDMTFVEVDDRGDLVRVSKQNGRLRVEVRERGSRGVDVEVTVSANAIARLLS